MENSVKLKKGEGRTIKKGGLWIYDNEIAEENILTENGDIVDVYDFDGFFLGNGFINTNSHIRVRMLTRRTRIGQDITLEELIRIRVKNAWEYRKSVSDTSSCRLIFGEADFLPGLVVDKFEDVLVVESLALGIDRLKNSILDELKKVLKEDNINIRGIYERSDAKVRLDEGLQRYKGFIGKEFDTKIQITENGVKYFVDVLDGQKTGFFLDQKYNRQAAARLAKGRTVLDCCTHTGSFGLNCAAAGAARVTCVDVSASAIEMTRRNAALNDIDIETEKADVFDFLRRRIDARDRSADLIILDPPAFTKSSKTVGNAKNGYTELNALGMRLLPRGGYLATASCSHFMTPPLFTAMLEDAARSVGVKLRCVERRGASPDHPVLSGVPQTEYLKFHIYQVI